MLPEGEGGTGLRGSTCGNGMGVRHTIKILKKPKAEIKQEGYWKINVHHTITDSIII